jgi:hypothetical protein
VFARGRVSCSGCKGSCSPSARGGTVVGAMFLATLICSDERCADEIELLVSHELDALDGAACACGCTLVLLAVSGWERAARPAPVLAAAA